MILVSFCSEDNVLSDEIKICYIFEYQSNENRAFRFFPHFYYDNNNNYIIITWLLSLLRLYHHNRPEPKTSAANAYALVDLSAVMQNP